MCALAKMHTCLGTLELPQLFCNVTVLPPSPSCFPQLLSMGYGITYGIKGTLKAAVDLKRTVKDHRAKHRALPFNNVDAATPIFLKPTS
jgi:hypothetical protein